MRPGGGRGKSSRNAGGRGRNRGGSRARGGVDGEMNNYHRNGKLTLDDITRYTFRNATHEERLLAYLFEDYEPVARAVMDSNRTVTVSVDFVLLRIHGLDERSQVLTTTGLVIAEWTDERLTWDPEEFGNLTNIIVKADRLWLPELAVMNGADELMPDFDRIRVLLHSDGLLHWEPGGIFRTTCDINIAYFPFDSQRCPMLIGAYSYHSSRMNITNASRAISTHDFRVNGEWHIISTSAEYGVTILSPPNASPAPDDDATDSGEKDEAVEGYAHVIFTLHLKRRYKFYVMNIVLPCVMLSVLIMIGFCLPPDAGEKISLGISVLLAFTVFLLMIADAIPRTSLAIPLIVTYLMTTMTLGTVSVCMTVLVLNVHHRGAETRMSPWLRSFALVHLARVVGVRTGALDAARGRRQPSTGCGKASSSSPRPPTTTSGILRRRPAQDQRQSGDHGGPERLGNDVSRTFSCHYVPLDAVANDVTANLAANNDVGSTKFFPAGTETSRNGPACVDLRVNSLVMSYGRRWRTQQQRRRRRPLFDTAGSIVGDRLSRSGGDLVVDSFAVRSPPPSPRTAAVNDDDDDDETHLGEIVDDRGPCGSVSVDSDVIASEWTEMARVLDRTFFWLLFALMTLSAIVILLYPKYTGNEDGWTFDG